jgi:hypothetical protein
MTMTHRRIDDDTLQPLCGIAYSDRAQTMPYDWATSGITAKFEIEKEDGTAVLAATATGMTAHPTQTFTAASTGLATCNGHGVKEGDQLIVATSGTLPSGLAASTRYFAVNVNPNTFGLASVPGGVSLIAGAGSGTHTFYVVGSWQYDFSSVAAGTVGRFRGWASAVNGSAEIATFPADEYGIGIEILPKGN